MNVQLLQHKPSHKQIHAHRHIARERAMQFLYQCERERMFFFSPVAFENFCIHFDVREDAADYMRSIIEGVLLSLPEIDTKISELSTNWKLERMCSIDRCVLRIAIWEISQSLTPKKVVINEAIDIAKRYGTEHSGRFVNGILDRAARAS